MWLTILSNFLQFVLLGAIGIFVSTYPETTTNHKRKILWIFLAASVAIGGISSWQAYKQQKESDGRYDGVHGQLSGVQTQLGEQKTLLNNVTAQNAKLLAAIDNLGKAAHVPAGTNLDDTVRGIINKLPKASAVSVTNATGDISGHDNITSIGSSGQTARTIINNGPPPTPDHFYQGGIDYGFGEGPTVKDGTIVFRVFHVTEGIDWNKEFDYNDQKLQCDSPFDGRHSYGQASGPGPTWFKIWDVTCRIK